MINMISENLKRLRKIYQYTQEQVAEKINVSRQSIAKWESGESTPDIASCIELAKFRGLAIVHQRDLINFIGEIGIPRKNDD
ncbi:helix-turn-helix transcriptional regulator [Clostridium tertium]|uniref:helix-turn-helix transcriptional regulator n=3 Tax=Clostridium TaxID=1485 RepID=UPI003119A012